MPTSIPSKISDLYFLMNSSQLLQLLLFSEQKSNTFT